MGENSRNLLFVKVPRLNWSFVLIRVENTAWLWVDTSSREVESQRALSKELEFSRSESLGLAE